MLVCKPAYLGLGHLRQDRQQQRIHFLGILASHLPQGLIARIAGPFGTAERLGQPVPFTARAARKADLAVLAGQDDEGIGATGTGSSASGALPTHAVMNVEAAVHTDIAGQHISQGNIDNARAPGTRRRLQGHQGGGGQVSPGLRRQDLGRDSERCPSRFTQRPGDTADRLRIKFRCRNIRQRPFQAKDRGHGQNQFRAPPCQGRQRLADKALQFPHIVTDQQCGSIQRSVQRLTGPLADMEMVQRERDGRRFTSGAVGQVEQIDFRPHAAEQPAAIGAGNAPTDLHDPQWRGSCPASVHLAKTLSGRAPTALATRLM